MFQSNHWVGTVLLNTCQVIERPSKKDGFCFKLFHPLEQSIWAPRGPEKETIGLYLFRDIFKINILFNLLDWYKVLKTIKAFFFSVSEKMSFTSFTCTDPFLQCKMHYISYIGVGTLG